MSDLMKLSLVPIFERLCFGFPVIILFFFTTIKNFQPKKRVKTNKQTKHMT